MQTSSARAALLIAVAVVAGAACSTSSSSGVAADAGGTAGDAGAASDASADTSCIDSTSPGQHAFTCDGMKVAVAVPSSCPPTGCGVVLDIHGTFMTGDAEDSHTNLRALGTAAGYVVVQPTAPTETPQGPSWLPSDDDLVWKNLERVIAAFAIDTSKVHVTGISAGGYMTWRLVCKHADALASAAPAAAGGVSCTVTGLNDTCAFSASSKPSRTLDLLFLIGTKDAVVPPACMDEERDAVIAAWSLGAAQQVAGDATYRRTRYAGSDGKALEVLEHDYTTDPNGPLASNKGHCFPGSTASTGSILDALKCQPPNSFAWGAEAMKFFVAHPRH